MSRTSNRGAVLIGVLWSQGGLAALFIVARFYTRYLVEPKAGWDDWTMLIALLLAFASIAVLTAGVHHGLGSHQETINSGAASQALELQWIFQPLQVASTVFSRLSVAILLKRIFPTKILMKWFLMFLVLMNAVVGIVGVTLIFTQCNPPRRLWDDSIQGKCMDPNIQKGIALLKATISASSDLATAVWPISIVWTLQMKTRKKAFLGTLFALTIVAMVCEVVECSFISTNTVRTDETYASALQEIILSTSANVMVIVGSIPTLPPLFKRYLRSEYSDNKRSSHPTSRSRYIHPITHNTVDIYPLHELHEPSHIATVQARKDTPDPDSGDSRTSTFIDEEAIMGGGIKKTTAFDVTVQA